MYTNRITVSSIAILTMACCLALEGFASPALAKTIVVTTLTDTADPPFDADGPCGTGTIGNLPGADGKVSLREAIIAANNTPGADTITFQSGGIIEVKFDDSDSDGDPDPLPVLCGGQTRIKGALNGDDTPDITLDGAAFPPFPLVAGLLVLSSHNTIQGLQVQHFRLGIVVTSPASDTQITHTTVTHNEVRENGLVGIYMLSLGDRNVFSHATFARNTVASNGSVGIGAQRDVSLQWHSRHPHPYKPNFTQFHLSYETEKQKQRRRRSPRSLYRGLTQLPITLTNFRLQPRSKRTTVPS
jgi:hypothetical protein